VVDYRSQAVSAISKLHLRSGLPILLIWGDQDRIIPVAHGYAAHDAVPGSRLEVLAGVGHFPQVESPTAVAEVLGDFIATTGEMPIWRIEHRDQDRGAASFEQLAEKLSKPEYAEHAVSDWVAADHKSR
jgi:hypothetical protein